MGVCARVCACVRVCARAYVACVRVCACGFELFTIILFTVAPNPHTSGVVEIARCGCGMVRDVTGWYGMVRDGNTVRDGNGW